VVNGEIAGTTPLLLRDRPPGETEVLLMKPGYLPASARVELRNGEVVVVQPELEPTSFVAAFSSRTDVLGQQEFAQQAAQLRLPVGSYRIDSDNGALSIAPVYPRESGLRAARLVTVAAGIAAMISTVEDVWISDGRSYFTSYLPSPGTIATWVTATGAAGFWIALEADKQRYEEATKINQFVGTLTPAEVEAFYLEAEQALAIGDLPRALAGYARVMEGGDDSIYVPPSIYKAGQIYSSTGDDELAMGLWRRILNDYPDPAVYDRAARSLSETLADQEEFEAAVQALDLMTFVDPLFAREDVEQDRARLQTRAESQREELP
jgi:tetratricopeptide (TPR) repeat protein